MLFGAVGAAGAPRSRLHGYQKPYLGLCPPPLGPAPCTERSIGTRAANCAAISHDRRPCCTPPAGAAPPAAAGPAPAPADAAKHELAGGMEDPFHAQLHLPELDDDCLRLLLGEDADESAAPAAAAQTGAPAAPAAAGSGNASEKSSACHGETGAIADAAGARLPLLAVCCCCAPHCAPPPQAAPMRPHAASSVPARYAMLAAAEEPAAAVGEVEAASRQPAHPEDDDDIAMLFGESR